MRRHSGDLEGINVLFVCTGNQCRSPAAEVLLRRRLEQRGISATIRSAGLLEGGQPASVVLAELGTAYEDLELTTHRSHVITRALVTDADLVVGMAREHVREAIALAPEAWPRSFTLKELVRRGQHIGPRLEKESVAGWLARAHGGRAPSTLVSWSRRLDVRDPGLSVEASRAMLRELSQLMDQLVALVWPLSGPAGGLRPRA